MIVASSEALDCVRRVAALPRSLGDDLVRDIWDELEFSHRKDSPAARRRRCREWGVVYRERRKEISEFTESSPAL